MVFCQSCGARNTEDSHFCNMCGTKIARSGEPGGPVGGGVREPSPKTAPIAPFGAPSESGTSTGTNTTLSGSSVSLSAIGVRSPARTYGIMIAAGLALFALGAVGMWLMMRPGDEPVADAGEGEGAGESEEGGGAIEIGDPVPEGEEAPPEIDFVPGTPRPVTRPTKRASTGGSGGRATAGGTTGGATGGSGTASGSAGGTGTTGGTGTGSTETGTETRTETATETGTGTGTTTTQPDPTPGSPATGGSGSVDWDRAGGGVVDERSEEDVLMDAYTAHVRRYIREYYVRRAQACFDHETRVDQSTVRGTVLIGFTILGSGEVRNATVDRNTTGRDALGACLQRQVAGWRLPRPPEGIDELALQMPFSR